MTKIPVFGEIQIGNLVKWVVDVLLKMVNQSLHRLELVLENHSVTEKMKLILKPGPELAQEILADRIEILLCQNETVAFVESLILVLVL